MPTTSVSSFTIKLDGASCLGLVTRCPMAQACYPAEAFRLGKVTIIRSNKAGVFMLNRNGMVERVENMLPGFDGELRGARHHFRPIVDGKLQCCKPLYIVDSRRG